jgi:hypothetical protein
VVDPIGLAPTFLSVTTGIPDGARRDVALRAAVIAGAILTGAALIGDWLLRQLGITLPPPPYPPPLAGEGREGARRTSPVLDRVRNGAGGAHRAAVARR